MNTFEFVIRLLAAMLAGGIVGLEREWSHKSAGLKTNMLVAVGSCIFVLISIFVSDANVNRTDPTRIIGQIVTGIGFLGGGVILHKGANVQGLTTAATIWCSAAIGCVAGLGMYLETAVCTALVLTVNLLFKQLERRLEAQKKQEKTVEKQADT